MSKIFTKRTDTIISLFFFLAILGILSVAVITSFMSTIESNDRKDALESNGYFYVESFSEFPNQTMIDFKVENYCDDNEHLITNERFKIVNKKNFKEKDSVSFILYCKENN